MALESMTGFARVEKEAPNGSRLICEIRSVNGKSLDMRLKLPPGLERLEPQVRQLVQGRIVRGNLQLSLSHETRAGAEGLQINHATVDAILALAASLHERHGLALPTVGELLSIRGVVEGTASVESPELDALILEAAAAAVEELKTFRGREGAALVTLLKAQMDSIDELVSRAESDGSRTPAAIRERLAAQVRLLMDSVQGFDEQRLSMEAALLATRSDIREELDRLRGHIAAVRALVQGDGPVGRKLDFLAQEFNREANTLCSKSNAASITAIGLELKAVVDQFREQVQNLE